MDLTTDVIEILRERAYLYGYGAAMEGLVSVADELPGPLGPVPTMKAEADANRLKDAIADPECSRGISRWLRDHKK